MRAPRVLGHSVQFTSVQFSSRWYVCARESSHTHHFVTQEFPQCCLWNSSNVGLNACRWPFLVPLKKDRWVLPLNLRFSPQSRRSMVWWCDVLWLCAQQVVSQAPQHFRSSETQSCLWRLLFPGSFSAPFAKFDILKSTGHFKAKAEVWSSYFDLFYLWGRTRFEKAIIYSKETGELKYSWCIFASQYWL